MTTPETLKAFVEYCQQHLRGDEKSEAQTFLTKLFQAIVASGGNLRDLFALVNYAADNALGREASQINAADMTDSVTNLRSDYQRRLLTRQ